MLRVLLAVLSLLALACPGPSAPPASTPVVKDVAVTVNGKPISEREVQLHMRDRHGAGLGKTSLTRDEAIDFLVELELDAQAAVARGLDKDPDHLAELELMETQLRDAKRQALARLFRRKAAGEQAEVPEASVRAWYDANQAVVRASVKLRRLSVKGEAEAEAIHKRLVAGETMEQVATEGNAPQEMGPVAFDVLPVDWVQYLEGVPVGGYTRPVRFAHGKYIVFQVVERQEQPLPPFEAVKERVVGILQAQAFARKMESLKEERKKAVIQKF